MQLATKARTTAFLTAIAACGLPGVAEATERQWFFGGSVGYAYIDETYKWWDGGFVAAEMRYGITDAIDFTTALDLGFYPDAEQIVAFNSACSNASPAACAASLSFVIATHPLHLPQTTRRPQTSGELRMSLRRHGRPHNSAR